MVTLIDNNRVLRAVGKEGSFVTQTKSSLQKVRLLPSKCILGSGRLLNKCPVTTLEALRYKPEGCGFDS